MENIENDLFLEFLIQTQISSDLLLDMDEEQKELFLLEFKNGIID